MAVKTKQDGIKKIKKIECGLEKISDLDQELQCLLALGFLGGNSKKIYTEEIAVQLFKWMPKMYGWKLKKYCKFPDKQMPKRGLSYLRTYEWAVGGFNENILKDGWRLTTEGNDVYIMIKHLHSAKKIEKSFSKSELDFLNRKIRDSELYQKYLKAKNLEKNLKTDIYDISDFLSVSVGMDKYIRASFYDLYSKAKDINADKYIDFLESLKSNHKDLLDHSKYVNDSREKNKKNS